MWHHLSQESHCCIALWVFATAFPHMQQGHFTGPGFKEVSADSIICFTFQILHDTTVIIYFITVLHDTTVISILLL